MKPRKEERELFRKAMEGVNPLKKGVKTSQKEKTSPLPKKRKAMAESPSSYTPLSDGLDFNIGIEDKLYFFRVGLEKKRQQKFIKGEIAFEAKLDLHHMKREQAHLQLDRFIKAQLSQGTRCCLIVHGKGKGIIKNLCFHWLKQYPEVLAIHTALPRHGGTGAAYVYLKRRK